MPKVIEHRSAKLKMSKEDEEILVYFMRKNPFMWDFAHKEYKNNAKKDEKWKELAAILNKDGKFIYVS